MTDATFASSWTYVSPFVAPLVIAAAVALNRDPGAKQRAGSNVATPATGP